MTDFVHLHCHTEFSLLDGAIRLPDLCARACEYKMPAAAITDHGNMFGAVKFFLEAKKAGIKPILGCEVYVAKTNYKDRETEDSRVRYHLTLLAKDLKGYRNLVRLVSMGYLEGFHYKPRIDKALLNQHGDGLIALSGCLQGEVQKKLLEQGFDAGLAAAREYAALFPNSFYLEVQANGIEKQKRANEMLEELAHESGLPLVATNDCHYLDRTDCEAHDVLLCVQTNAVVEDEKRMRIDSDQLYYRSPEEMAAEFAHAPEALANTMRIAEQCNVELPLDRLCFPAYDLPEGKSLSDELKDMSYAGLEERIAAMPYEIDEDAYWKRLDYELDVINRMGFPGYFLIVQDFINWAKEKKIPVGPGRGSAAGSLVSYALKITNLDPIPYNLLFERFLNIERVSMPDIDVDFCERRRGEVIRYVTEKYGEDAVAQITTFGTMKARAVVRDVGRAMGMSFSEVDKIAKLIPEEMKMTIEKALGKELELKALADSDERIGKLIDVSRRLEGLHRHASTHAAGVVISDRPMIEYLPLYKGKKEEVVTQFDMKMVEKVGLIKFDFLGLRTMTVIQDSLENIAHQGKVPPDLDALALDDKETYELYSRGETDGVFQVESSGMRKYLRMLKPSCFDDIIAMLALYRPGPLGSGMVDVFINRKHGREPVEYPVPELEPVLRSTYGVIVYQEQVMKIAQVVGGYSLGQADLLRRAMGKKIAEAMAEQRAIFIKGSQDKGYSKDKAAEIFDLMEKFAQYGFNKSHSAAYALISYYTAYLKTHYPSEFMAALITSEMGNQDKVLQHIGACRDMDIRVRPPNVNLSFREFSVTEDGAIVYGLGGIKNVGDEAIREIVREREKEGEYKSMLDLCTRVNMRKVTKRVMESLIKAGALDCFGCARAALTDALDRVVSVAQNRARQRDSGQTSLFAAVGQEEPCLPGTGLEMHEPAVEEWSDDEKLRQEKEVLGFFLSNHPLMPLRQEMKRLNLNTVAECSELPPGAQVRVGVIATGVKEHLTKKGDKMAFVQIEDLAGSGEATLFPETYAKARNWMDEDKPLLVTAEISRYRNGQDEEEEGPRPVKLTASDVALLTDAFDSSDMPVVLDVPARRLESGGMARFSETLARYPGKTGVRLHVHLGDSVVRLEVGPRFSVWPCPEFWREMEEWTAPLAPSAEKDVFSDSESDYEEAAV